MNLVTGSGKAALIAMVLAGIAPGQPAQATQSGQEQLLAAQRSLEVRRDPSAALPLFAQLVNESTLAVNARGQAAIGQVTCLLMLGRNEEARAVWSGLSASVLAAVNAEMTSVFEAFGYVSPEQDPGEDQAGVQPERLDGMVRSLLENDSTASIRRMGGVVVPALVRIGRSTDDHGLLIKAVQQLAVLVVEQQSPAAIEFFTGLDPASDPVAVLALDHLADQLISGTIMQYRLDDRFDMTQLAPMLDRFASSDLTDEARASLAILMAMRRDEVGTRFVTDFVRSAEVNREAKRKPIVASLWGPESQASAVVRAALECSRGDTQLEIARWLNLERHPQVWLPLFQHPDLEIRLEAFSHALTADQPLVEELSRESIDTLAAAYVQTMMEATPEQALRSSMVWVGPVSQVSSWRGTTVVPVYANTGSLTGGDWSDVWTRMRGEGELRGLLVELPLKPQDIGRMLEHFRPSRGIVKRVTHMLPNRGTPTATIEDVYEQLLRWLAFQLETPAARDLLVQLAAEGDNDAVDAMLASYPTDARRQAMARYVDRAPNSSSAPRVWAELVRRNSSHGRDLLRTRLREAGYPNWLHGVPSEALLSHGPREEQVAWIEELLASDAPRESKGEAITWIRNRVNDSLGQNGDRRDRPEPTLPQAGTAEARQAAALAGVVATARNSLSLRAEAADVLAFLAGPKALLPLLGKLEVGVDSKPVALVNQVGGVAIQSIRVSDWDGLQLLIGSLAGRGIHSLAQLAAALDSVPAEQAGLVRGLIDSSRPLLQQVENSTDIRAWFGERLLATDDPVLAKAFWGAMIHAHLDLDGEELPNAWVERGLDLELQDAIQRLSDSQVEAYRDRLTELFRTSDSVGVAREALDALTDNFDERSGPLLVEALNHPRQAGFATERLQRLRLYFDEKAYWERLIEGDAAVESPLTALVKQTRDRDREIRLYAIRALGALGEAAALPTLIELMRAEDEEVAGAARAAADRLLESGSQDDG